MFVFASAIVFGIGLILVTATAVLTPSSTERPRISASISTDPSLALTGANKASGLKSSDKMIVAVEGLSESGLGTLIYTSRTGPDATGAVDLPRSLPIAPESFERIAIGARLGEQPLDCSLDQVPNGCVTLRVPQVCQRQARQLCDYSGPWGFQGSMRSGDTHSSQLSARPARELPTRRDFIYGMGPPLFSFCGQIRIVR